MKIRTLIVSILGVLVVSSVSPAQETVALEQKLQELATSTPTPQAPRPPRRIAKPALTPSSVHPMVSRTKQAAPPKTPTVVKIFQLKYTMAEELAILITNVLRIPVQPDDRGNRLIVNATKEQMESVESLIQAMDVPDPEASTPRDIQNLVYRIYMFEIASGDRGMKPFSMILRTSTHVSSQELLDAAADKDLQISEFLQSNDFTKPQVEILIQGKATSNESLTRMVEKFPDSHIIELKWDDDETFTNNIAAAQYTQLPEQMQKHIRKFLGDDIRTVGYWFGNLSVPGTVEAPIGPWTLKLVLDAESDRMLELSIDVVMRAQLQPLDMRLGRSRDSEIISNTIRAKIGKPIIIGYNRESYGTRKMGAIVIVPEADSLQSDTADTNSF